MNARTHLSSGEVAVTILPYRDKDSRREKNFIYYLLPQKQLKRGVEKENRRGTSALSSASSPYGLQLFSAGFQAFPFLSFGRLFVKASFLDFPDKPIFLYLAFQGLQCLFNIFVDYFNFGSDFFPPFFRTFKRS